jgi:mono/diheme cytochrome c family protein
MKQFNMKVAGVCAGLALLAGTCAAQQGRVDFGQREFVASCASCHGASGKGDGVLRDHLTKPPSDLTTLARRNGGVFPAQRVRDTIDGRGSIDIGPHGSREMPVWGQVYSAEDTQPYELHGRIRINALVDYLVRIQEK